MMFSYNLIDEPWIPVLDREGKVQPSSIRNVLIQSQQYRQLAASLPHTNAALFRLLLAILFRVFGPIDISLWKKIWQQQSFDEAQLNAYLQNWHQRFDLFDSERPFFNDKTRMLKLNRPIFCYSTRVGGIQKRSLTIASTMFHCILHQHRRRWRW